MGDVNPIHNSKCELFTFSSIVNRQFDREARLDVYNGIMNPKEAWNRVIGSLFSFFEVYKTHSFIINHD